MAIPISELRIGSRTHTSGGYPFVITELRPTTTYGVYLAFNKNGWKELTSELKGIPLTRELLAKHGFTIPIGKTIDDKNYQNARIIFNGLELIIGVQPPLEYLHQLQTLIYSLTGRELQSK